jgi:predicted PurR-regulated permease PerM
VLATTTVLALVTFVTEGIGAVVILLVFLALLIVLQQRTLAPRLGGTGPKVNPGIALMALAIGGALFGVLGLFAAVPVLAALLAFVPAIVQVLGTGPRATGMADDGMVPLWLDRLGQVSWRTLVVLGLLWVVGQAIVIPILSLPVILAAILACVLKPIETWARGRGLGATASALFATVASIAVVILTVGLTIYSLVGSLPDIVQQTTIGAGSLNLGATPVDFIRSIGDGLLSSVAAAIANAAGIAIGIAIALVLTFFLLRDGDKWWAALLRYVPASRRGGVDEVGTTSASILYGSMVGTAIVSFAGAVMQFITMAILGLPLAFPISVLMFFGGFIPYIGSLIVTLLGFLVAVSVGSTADIILMGIFTIVFNIVQGNIVAPIVYSRVVSIHPAVVLVAIPAGNAVAGVIGMFLVVPFLGVVAAVWRTVLRVLDTGPVEAVDTTTPPPEPAELIPNVAPTGG